jgi:hypothetical protein
MARTKYISPAEAAINFLPSKIPPKTPLQPRPPEVSRCKVLK